MTNSPDDRIDSYEPRLARRVDAFADQAVRPIDARAIAAAAHAGARRQTLAGRLFGSTASMARLGVVLAGALVAALAFGAYLGGGGNVAPSQTATAAGPTASEAPATEAPPSVAPPIQASPTPVPGPEACAASQLTGEIVGWDGAAGHRIASLNLHNVGPAECKLPKLLRPALVDADGGALIVGAAVTDNRTMTFKVGNAASTLVDMANYCGATPTAGLRIRLFLPDQTSFELAPHLDSPGTADPPPCNGPTQPATIEMQPIQP